VRLIPGSAWNSIAVNAVQQSNLNRNENKNYDNSTFKTINRPVAFAARFSSHPTSALLLCSFAAGAGRSDLSVGHLNNGAQTVHFTAAYENLIGGFFTCAGERITKTAPKPFTKDSEDCTITDLSTFPPGTYVGDPIFVVNGVGYTWSSDYDGLVANLVTLTVTDNGDGTGHIALVAYY
jgi:hypothetical protein